MINKNLGPIFIFLSALCFSLGGLFTKLLPWQALSIGSGRCILSTLVLLIFAKITKHRFTFNKTVLFGGLCLCATVTTYVIANKMTTAANAIILQYSAPIFIIVFTLVLFHKKPSQLEFVSCIFVFTGIILFFIDGLESGKMVGNLIALSSGFFYAFVCMMNSFDEADPMSSMLIGHSLSALIGLPSLIQETAFTSVTIFCIFILGVFQLGLGYVLFTEGLKTTSPISVSLISTVEPILNPILVAVFYGEMISFTSFVGAIIVLITISFYHVQSSLH